MPNTTIQSVTLAIAVLGAALGLMNAWRAWSSDRLRLRVRSVLTVQQHGDPMLGVEIVNLSTFAVTIADFGWTMRGSTRRLAMVTPIFASNDRMPVRLEPRTSVTGWAAPGAHQDLAFTTIKHVYATTACGVTRKRSGKSAADMAKRALA